MKSKKPAARSHTVRVVDHLGEAIVSGRLPQGTLLPGDQELLAEYGVSRTVLREALRTLSAKGMLQARARVGTRVQPRSAWTLFDPDVLRWHRDAGLDPGGALDSQDFLRQAIIGRPTAIPIRKNSIAVAAPYPIRK